MIPHFVQGRLAEIQLFQPPAVLQMLDFRESEFLPLEFLFGNSNSPEVEIGCGTGGFLLERAARYPGINFLGIDRVSKWMKAGQKKSEKMDLGNLRFLKAHAASVLERLLPGTVLAFHIYFPDPWPKRRHRRRRLLTKDFLELLRGRLVAGGRIETATDDEDYFMQIKKAVEGIPWGSRREGDRRLFGEGKTNYENKYQAAGRRLYYLELQK